jgi:hypothetical protein
VPRETGEIVTGGVLLELNPALVAQALVQINDRWPA